MPTYEEEIIREAKLVARYQHRRRKLRAQLRETERALRHARKTLKALTLASKARDTDWTQSGAASKVFGVLPGTRQES